MLANESFQFNIWSLILCFAIFQSAHLIFILLIKREKSSPNRILIALLATLAFLLINQVIVYSKLFPYVPNLQWVGFPFWYILTPLFYLYAISLIQPNFRFRWHYLLHLIPALLIVIMYLPFYVLPTETKLAIALGDYRGAPVITDFKWLWKYGTVFLYLFQAVAYLTIAYVKIKKFQSAQKHVSSNTALVFFDSLKTIFLIVLAYLIIESFATLSLIMLNSYFPEVVFLAICTLSILIFWLTTVAMRFPDKMQILNTGFTETISLQVVEIDSKEVFLENKQFENGNRLPFEKQYYFDQLNMLMNTDKLYRENELTLSQLAEKLNLSTHQMSYFLNNEIGLRFYDYINHFRLEDAKSQLIDPEKSNHTILAIALEAGFNSQASFYRIFKKAVGISPGEYAKKQTLHEQIHTS